ncbi:3-oxo-tetronate kinase [Glycomyces mayteni]|uniref:3-oxo-tetronate kinase n=1 Tax=Glycomyces mayteni TaxID=543887 RepID=A0ABW2DGG3_9ACTN
MGCVADDYTGGTDAAASLRRAGLRTVLRFGRPEPGEPLPECDAVVIAVKTRNVPAAEAVAAALAVRDWLGPVAEAYFKYCSTFDSTDAGNIGPVADALLDATGRALAVVCPASPAHGRTVYRGHLFVEDRLLSDSSMRHHPLTPMTDSDLVRVLARQTPHPVGLLRLDTVRRGPAAVRARLETLAAQGVRHVVADATADEDLTAVAEAARGFALATGGAGLAGALGLAEATGSAAPVGAARTASKGPAGAARPSEVPEPPSTPGLVLAGSCSAATLAQVAAAREAFPSYRLDPASTSDPAELLARASTWRKAHPGGPAMVYASAPAAERGASRLGPDTAAILERTLAALAVEAVAAGTRRLVVAGGETSGAVVEALGVRAVEVGAEADRGVPWCVTADGLALLLKSGNFGAPDLLVRSAAA